MMMTRIHCAGCGEHWMLHPADEAAGLSSRKVALRAYKPPSHSRGSVTHQGEHTHILQEELPTLLCDDCGCPIPNGVLAYAITVWHLGETPTDWEAEYGTVR